MLRLEPMVVLCYILPPYHDRRVQPHRQTKTSELKHIQQRVVMANADLHELSGRINNLILKYSSNVEVNGSFTMCSSANDDI